MGKPFSVVQSEIAGSDENLCYPSYPLKFSMYYVPMEMYWVFFTSKISE